MSILKSNEIDLMDDYHNFRNFFNLKNRKTEMVINKLSNVVKVKKNIEDEIEEKSYIKSGYFE